MSTQPNSLSGTAVAHAIWVDPRRLKTDKNIRHSLLPSRVESMAKSIIDRNGIMQPLEVAPLDPPETAYDYRVTDGHYRQAAAVQLLEQGATLAGGAELLAPVLLINPGSNKERILRQLAANIEGQELTPIDIGKAIVEMEAEGFTRQEIRAAFTRPSTKKGGKVRPASNAYINMMKSFLTLPKSAMELIHSGKVGVKAAYTLTRVKPEKRQAVIDRAVEEFDELYANLDKDDERIAEQEKKQAELEAKAVSQDAEVEKAKAAALAAQAAAEEKAVVAKQAAEVVKTKGLDAKVKKAAEEAAKKAEEAAADAQKAVLKAKADEEKAAEKKAALAKTAEEFKKKLEEQRKLNVKSVSSEAVSKAAKAEGAAQEGIRPLSATDMRDLIDSIAAPSGYAKVQQIGKVLQAAFHGDEKGKQPGPSEVIKLIAKIVGDVKTKEKAEKEAA